MARYKPVDTQPKFIAIDLAAQLLPGSFEHALHHLLESAIDLAPFDARYRNDTTGTPAYAPAYARASLLRVVLFAYSHGLVSSRRYATPDHPRPATRADRGHPPRGEGPTAALL